MELVKSWIWKEYEIHERLDECFRRFFPRIIETVPSIDETTIRRLLRDCFPETVKGLPFQIIPHTPQERRMKEPGCPVLLIVIVGVRNFADRTLETLSILRKCKGKVQAILYLTLGWSMKMDEQLKFVATVFRDYGVLDVCRREPIISAPPIYY